MYLHWSLILMIPGLLLGMYAQAKVSGAYKKYSNVAISGSYTGADVARRMLGDNNLGHIRIEEVAGTMSDHYDPRSGVVRLSHDVYHGRTIAALGIAAHEIGHAIQDGEGYGALKIRNAVIPVTNFGSMLYFPLLLLGMLMSAPVLIQWGIILFSVIVFFQLITLPVEFDASRRALVTLETDGFLNQDEMVGARKVLGAAALTYVAAAVTAILELLRLVILFGGRNE